MKIGRRVTRHPRPGRTSHWNASRSTPPPTSPHCLARCATTPRTVGGQQLIRRVFRKAGEQRALSEIDYLLAINDRTRIGALRYRREGEETFDHNIGRYYRVPPLIRLPALLTPSPKPQLIRADQPKIATESVHPLTRVAVMLIAPLNLRGDRLDTTSCSLMESGTCQP